MIAITSESNRPGPNRVNIFENWTKAFKYFEDNVFIGMDSDAVLTPGDVEIALKELKNFHFVYIPTDPSHTHGLWAVKKVVINEVPFTYQPNNRCPICNWMNDILRYQFSTKRIEYQIRQIPRITIQRRDDHEKVYPNPDR